MFKNVIIRQSEEKERVLEDPRTVENPRSVPCVRHVVARDGEGVMRT